MMSNAYGIAIQRSKTLLLAAAATFALTSAACDNAKSAPSMPTKAAVKVAKVQRIKGAQARKLVAAGAFLLDVRTSGEFNGGHAEGATNISVQSLSKRMGELGADKERAVVVYCQSGARSDSAATMLVRAGYKNVYDLATFGAWKANQ